MDEKTAIWLKEVQQAFPELKGCSFVRELHTYGQALQVKQEHANATQHKGLGRRMMLEAERLTKNTV